MCIINFKYSVKLCSKIKEELPLATLSLPIPLADNFPVS